MKMNHDFIERNIGVMIVLVVLLVAVGGLLYLGGMLIMAWNVVMTSMNGKSVPVLIPPVAAHA